MRRFRVVLFVVAVGGFLSVSTRAQETLYRLNAGGPAFTDDLGHSWRSDEGLANTGKSIARQRLGGGAISDPPYDSLRFDSAPAPELSYRLPVPDGVYEVRLHFCEILPRYAAVGARVFDVDIEGQRKLTAFDIFAQVGFRKSCVQSLTGTLVDDGLLEIDFYRNAGDPAISGIEVIATPPPIDFEVDVLTTLTGPTVAALGPDGRVYVGSAFGRIVAYELDDDFGIVSTQTIGTLESASSSAILGLAISPFSDSNPVRLYVAHSQLYANGGSCFEGFSPYSGRVSILSGPSFDVIEPLVTGLPVSNQDHAVNGLAFDAAGDLMILVGGTTNGGVLDCAIGGLPESPLSGSLVKAAITRSGFNGSLLYHETASGQPNQDQSDGDIVDLDSGVDVSVHAAGLRNPFDLVWSTRGLLYVTDNGPNHGFGDRSTGASSQESMSTDIDELDLIEPNGYYGHANRNRGRSDPRQNVHHYTWEWAVPGVFTPAITTFPSSTNGLIEYRAATFFGAMRGNLLAQRWNSETYRIELSPSGQSVSSVSTLPQPLRSLDLIALPGGALLGVDYSGGRLWLARPRDPALEGFAVLDVFPWRAPAGGGNSFQIGGAGFGDLSNTRVLIDGQAATLTSVSSTRIRGTVPSISLVPDRLVDVVVEVGARSKTLPSSFRYLE